MSDQLLLRRLAHNFPGLALEGPSIRPGQLIGYLKKEMENSPDAEKLREIATATLPKKDETH